MRTSIMNDKDAVANAIASASSIKEAIENLGLRAAGGNYKAFRLACERHGLTLPRATGLSQTRAARESNRRSNNEIFVENSDYTNRSLLKKRLYEMGIPEECVSCGLGPEWNGKRLTLTLEHKNGVWNDHRIENLEILCPNCHSQTDTFCGGNK